MKRIFAILLVLFLLSGCSARSTPEASVPAAPATTTPEKEVITKESLRAEYEAQGFTVREIVPYEGDFLVYYETFPSTGIFQWVYTETGLHAPLLFSDRNILDYEILYKGAIRVLNGTNNPYNAAMSFPTYETAHTSLPVSQEGIASGDAYSSGSSQQETYWAPINESYTFGWNHGEVALVDVCISTGGIEAVFGPTAENLSGFFAAASGIPVTTTTYDETSNILTLTFRNTALTSGERTEFTDEADRQNYETQHGLYDLPTAFPAGTLKGSNAFIEKAEIQQAGDDTQLVLTLTELAHQYTAETGQLLRNESRPYLRILFRDTWDW